MKHQVRRPSRNDGSDWLLTGLAPQQDWSFVGGAWQERDGVITAPDNDVDENLAVYTHRAFGDFEAEFKFRWDGTFTNAGFLFRAADVQSYYLLHFPVVGQQFRAEHFWACLSKVNDTGFVKVLKMELIHGVSSHPSIWHEVRVSVQGNEIQAWVDHRPLSVVIDDTYPQPGYVGLSTYSALGDGAKSSFRDLRIRGAAVETPTWDAQQQPERNWVMLDRGPTMGLGRIVRTAEGEILAPSSRHQQSAGANLRSADKGRTWTVGEILPELNVRWGERRTEPDGRIESYYLPPGQLPWRIFKAVSSDHGRTWSDQRQVTEIRFPDDRPITALGSSGLLQLQDGTLLLFLSAGTGRDMKVIDGRMYYAAKPPGGVVMNMSVCIRSTDGGETWSSPISLDGPPYDAPMVKGLPSEISAVQIDDGSILTLARPWHSPFMWESWSVDGGQTWTPAARGPFPMYACSYAIVCTTSGAILIGGRFPGLAVQVSRDGGMTWTCYRIDTCGWANGAMIEVEPDIVAFLYGGKGDLRGQLLKVTDDDLVPLRQMRPLA